VKAVRVKSKCVKDRGEKGKGPKLIPKLKKGLLAKYGYHDVMHMTQKARRTALRKALKAYGRDNLIDKLNAVVVLNKNTNPALSRRFAMDRNWVEKQKKRSRSRSRSRKRKSKSKSKSRSRSRKRKRKSKSKKRSRSRSKKRKSKSKKRSRSRRR
jgi:hypothetical protein